MYLSIRKRLSISAIVIIFLVILLSSGIYIVFNKVKTINSEILNLHNNSLLLKERMIDHLQWMNALLESIITKKEFSGQTNPEKCAFGKWYYSKKKSNDFTSLSEDQVKIFNTIESFHNKLHASAIEIDNVKDTSEALKIYQKKTKGYVNNLQKLFFEYTSINEKEEDNKIQESENISSFLYAVIFILSIAVISIIILQFRRLSKKIVHSVNTIEEGIYRISKGDLFTPIETKKVNCSEMRNCGKEDCPVFGQVLNCCFIEVGSYAPYVKNEVHCPAILSGKFKDCMECSVMKKIVPDEMTFMIILLDNFRVRIRHIIKGIQDMIISLSVSSEEIASTCDSLAQNLQTEASSTEEISATVEELSAIQNNITDDSKVQFESINNLTEKMSDLSDMINLLGIETKETMSLTENISKQAQEREKSLNDMTNSMGKIGQSSGEMINSVKIINDISDQINLLSLNAAIEAARAGDAGRGFAVVADEISKLADQTAQSIKNIDQLIKDNENEISKGIDNVDDTVKTMSNIIHEVNNITEKMNVISQNMEKQMYANYVVNSETDQIKHRSDQIKICTEEQKIAFDEITKSMNSISELTQNNASGSEEISSNSDQIVKMSEDLNNEISFFQTTKQAE